ncbi:FadR/GntR family transcriptional regulator [Tropicimonas sp. TH_r6]|uniref:FadR/GntR family transcriptional regulator n=1 Tax=Tropicimonas sp. TH_r6 TaxID=3082085 RepID=UPI002953EFB3|nr:FadR/GntR family transcriptional regulator [Tropicimonas sp. TH_r6]MDV7141825.1 FadR/GntR family transcriptional regulator [Tropicimonas sp. TH_r6]
MNELLYYDLKQTSGLTHSLSAQVSRELGRKIVSGHYRPGDLLEDEAALADRYRVSRSVIRDAVKVLVGKGLLEVRRGIGTRVRNRNNWGLLDDDVLAWHQAAPPNPDLLRQLMDIRRVIEPKAARWAAELGSEEAHAEIAASQDSMEQEKGSIEDYIIADARFHRALLRSAGNDFLRAMEGVIFTALLNSIRLTNKDPRDNAASIPFHRAITDAVLARDGDSAEASMEEHLEDAWQRLQDYMKET